MEHVNFQQADKNHSKQMTNILFFISPHFLVKHYLLEDIREIVKKYPIRGDVIDVGCGSMPYKKLFKNAEKYVGIDFKSYSPNNSFSKHEPDVYFPKNYAKTLDLPLDSNSYDCTVSFQVLEHHKDPRKLIKECVRVTKKGGIVLLSFPFIWPLHEKPNDYYRLSEYWIADLAEKDSFTVLDIRKQGSIFSVIASLINDYLAIFSDKNTLNLLISILIYLPFLLLSYISLLLDKIFKSQEIFLNYVVVLKVNK